MRDAARGTAPAGHRSLRSTMTVVVGALGALSVATAAALVVITTEMHRLAGEVRQATSALRAAEDARAALLLHARTGDPGARAAAERDVAAAVAALDEDGAALARRAVDAYLTAEGRAGSGPSAARALSLALGELGELSERLGASAATAEHRLARWDETANVLGAAAALTLAATALAMVWWVRQRAFRPLLGLAAAMRRFAEGDTAARADAAGPAELAAMAGQFNAMAEALARRRESQLAFLAGVAHDLRNPLSALRLAARTASPDKPLPPEPSVRKTLALVERQTGRLERMLTDLVEAARLESGRLELRLETVDLGDLCAQAAALYADVSPLHRLTVVRPDGPVMARCDPVRLEQVVVNLLSNAIKYSPSGGEVRLEVAGEDGGVRLVVVDEGVGVPSGEELLVFEPFRRSERTRDLPGSGLGLAAVRRIVEAHGGTVGVEPNPSGGSRFTVVLPSSPPAAAPAREPPGGRQASDAGRR